MMQTILCICIILLSCAIIATNVQINKLKEKFEKIKGCHNGFIDTVVDTFDGLYYELNERVDEVNENFRDIHSILSANKEFADDVTDTMELMCDTDEIIIDRINDIEEELSYQNVAIDDLDALLYEMFEEKPEVEEKPAKKSKKK